MSKIAIAADFHWGVPGRLDDIHWAARVLREYCLQHDIDTVLTLGDLTHDRQSVELDVWNTLYDFLAETKAAGQNWYAFPGNHDMFLKHSWEFNSLRPLRDQITVIDQVSLMTINGRRFFILPFVHLEKSYMRLLHRLEELYQDGDVLLTHIGVRGATLNTCFLLKDWSYVDFTNSPFRRVYTGHFHSRQNLNDQVYYPGSPIPFKFDEGDVSHGFYILDTETMVHEFVDIWQAGKRLFPGEIGPPQYYTLLAEQLEEVDTAVLHNNMVRVAHSRDLSQDEREEIRDRLMARGCRMVRWLTLRQEAPATAMTGEVRIEALPASDPSLLFEWWMAQDTEGVLGLDQKLLRKLRAECVHEGDERYVYAEE